MFNYLGVKGNIVANLTTSNTLSLSLWKERYIARNIWITALIHTYISSFLGGRNCFGPTNSFEWNILVSKLKGAAQRTKVEAKLIQFN